MTKVVVTGAAGFVGGAVCHRLLEDGFDVVGVVRSSDQVERLKPKVIPAIAGTLGRQKSTSAYLTGAEVVVHLAARVHVMKDISTDPLLGFRLANVAATEHLAMEAASSGCRRLVYLSSIKVNGEGTAQGKAFTEEDPINPQDPYAISKSEAELALCRISKETGIEIVVLRPPLVYGSGVKGNFLTMLRAIKRGVPLPFLGVANRRSLVGVENLADAIACCVMHQAAASKTFLVSDGHDVSTPELVSELARCLGVPPRLFSIPESVLRLAGKITGKDQELDRLIGSLVVDSSKIRRELGWSPPYTFNEGIQRTVNWFKGVS